MNFLKRKWPRSNPSIFWFWYWLQPTHLRDSAFNQNFNAAAEKYLLTSWCIENWMSMHKIFLVVISRDSYGLKSGRCTTMHLKGNFHKFREKVKTAHLALLYFVFPFSPFFFSPFIIQAKKCMKRHCQRRHCPLRAMKYVSLSWLFCFIYF